LQDYLDGAVGAGSTANTTLDLGTSSWNATVGGFESASLAIAAGSNSIVTYAAIGSNLPDHLAGATGNASDNTLVGTSGADTLSGLGGNDILVGLGGDDSLLGGAGTDMLLCGAGSDTLNGGDGNDILSGGGGADTFVVDNLVSTDVVVDYSCVEGDKIDLSTLLDANFGPGSTVSDFVQLTQVGSNIVVQVDVDGAVGGANWVDVAVLANYGTTLPQDLVRLSFDGDDYFLKV
jgi:Ca2+-binding RTX toxin-like protein